MDVWSEHIPGCNSGYNIKKVSLGNFVFDQKIYGIDQSSLEKKGPSVSPLNGVIASLAVMEFIGHITSLTPPKFHLEYRGHLGTVTKKAPNSEGCRICRQVYGSGKEAKVERFIAG